MGTEIVQPEHSDAFMEIAAVFRSKAAAARNAAANAEFDDDALEWHSIGDTWLSAARIVEGRSECKSES